MSTIHNRHRLIRSPRDRRRGAFFRTGALGTLFFGLGFGVAACDGSVQETTTSRVQARPVGAGTASASPGGTGSRTMGGATDPAYGNGRGLRVGGPTSPPQPVVPVDWDTAEAAWRARDYPEAVRLFATWSGERPQNPWGRYMLGLSHWKAGDREAAEASLVETVALDPAHGKALVNLARVRLELGRPDDALAPALSATELDPTSPDAWRVLGRVHHGRGAVDEAIGAYQTAALLDRGDPWALNNLGLLMIEQERFEEALGPLARAAVVDSTLGVVQNNLGIALERTDRPTQALVAYRRAVELGAGERAGTSLTRVEGRPDGVGVLPVELATLALRYEEELVLRGASTTVAVRPDGEGDPR